MNRLVLALLALAGIVVAIVACDDNPRYVYTAQRYDSRRGCLEDFRGVETIPGDSVSVRCGQTCFTVGDDLYISPVCPPLPDNATELEQSDEECQAALDASRQEASCVGLQLADEDGGAEETDGGEEEDADAGGQEQDSGDAGVIIGDAAEAG